MNNGAGCVSFPKEWIRYDGEHYFLDVPEKEDESYWIEQFYLWMESCCEHPDMEAATERISNWGGYRKFQQALARAGWEHFPTLYEELPDYNQGQTSPEQAKKALDELRYFQEEADLGTITLLVDSETNKAIYSYIEAYGGSFLWDPQEKITFGIDEHDFFIRGFSGTSLSTSQCEELFRSMRFEQKVDKPVNGKRHVVFRDLETGKRFICGHFVDYNNRAPQFLHIEKRKATASDYDYILEPLTTVFQAAVETGNPVNWI